MNNLIICIIIVFTLFSCSKEVGNNKINENEQINESSTKILFNNNSVYSKFFDDNVEREVGYFSAKENVNTRDIVGFDNLYFSINKRASNMSLLFANGVIINSLSNKELMKSIDINDSKHNNLFGREVAFKFKSENTKSVNTSNDSITMYIPFIVDINYPVASATELQPLCPFDDLLVEWNKDENNVNGVVVIIEWDGHMIGKDKMNESIRTIDLVEDTGKAILNPELFKDIPDLAMVNITIMRGNIDIVEIESTAVKIYAASNSSITVVLTKEPI